MVIPVTAVVASFTAVLSLYLAYRVTVFRRKFKVGVGDNGEHDLQVAIRAHANLIEYAPMTLIMMGVGELNGISEAWIYGLGMLFVISRLAHAWGFIRSRGGVHPGRMFGVAGTWLVMLILAVLLVINVLQFSGRW